MSLFQPILQYFSQLGDILGSEVDSSGGNWVTIVYRQEWEAARAVRKNGDVLGGIWMVGVKWAVRAPHFHLSLGYPETSSS
jgi:nuclear pore complex protein Nup53